MVKHGSGSIILWDCVTAGFTGALKECQVNFISTQTI